MTPLLAVVPFGIRVLDQTDAPAPCVTFTTTDKQRFLSDQSGWIAFHEPGLMDDDVWFEISSTAYQVDPDFFGYRGVELRPREGQQTTVRVERVGAPLPCNIGTFQQQAVVSGFTDDPFELRVVDAATLRGVPLVRVTSGLSEYWTDSAGRIAIRELSLLGETATFTVDPVHGYHYAGAPIVVTVSEGGSATIEVERDNIAERLYRVTGRGVYRDSVLLGEVAPTEDPVIDGRVMGQDTIMVVPTDDGDLWLWGDTNRPDYPLGLFDMAGAIARPLADPADGIDLDYFVDPGTGFARAMAPIPGSGPTWLGGPAVVDDGGTDVTIAFYGNYDADLTANERGTAVWNEATSTFDKDQEWATVRPEVGIQVPNQRDGYVYLEEYMRFPATIEAAREPFRYWELLSPLLADGTVDLWPDGEERWDWRPLSNGASPGEIGGDTLIDMYSGAEIVAHNDSVAWSPWRHRWHRLFTQNGGTSWLGEMWYAEADTPYGPWIYTARVATHTNYTSYNPYIHQELSTNGRSILWEATYTAWLTDSTPTPRYDYNQMMYSLDLEDERLVLPVPVYRFDDSLGTSAALVHTLLEPTVDFLAADRPKTGLVPFSWDGPTCDGGKISLGDHGGVPVFWAAANDGPLNVPLWRATRSGEEALFVDVPPDWTPDPSPIAWVWPTQGQKHTMVRDWLPDTWVDAGDDLCVTEPSAGEGIVLRFDASASPGITGGYWSIEVDGVVRGSSAQVDLPLSAGKHVVVATWAATPDGTPYTDERWVSVAGATGGDTGGDTGDTDTDEPPPTGDTGGAETGDTDDTDDTDTDTDDGGCGCATSTPGSWWWAAPAGLLLLGRRRR